ncbi:hypothetical protein [Shewanella gaetbuli]
MKDWKPELCIQLSVADNSLADFNRLLVKGFPSTKQLQQGGEFEEADRKNFIYQLKERFFDKIEEGASHYSLHSLFRSLSLYIRWCDKEDIPAFTKLSLESYFFDLDKQVMLGKLKSASYVLKRSEMVTLFNNYLELPHSYFNSVVVGNRSDSEPFEAYTRKDLKQLLPFLRQLFKQTYQQFINAPEIHMTAYKSTPTMVFEWQGEQYKLFSGISKMMCAATYLLAYYTYVNSSDLFQLKQPNKSSMSLGEVWYTMPAFKRRAFKTIQVEMGGNELEVPKYALNFFDKLINASKIISPARNAPLLQTISHQKVKPLSAGLLQTFLRVWVEKHFDFKDQTGRRLRPVISRFRETGSQLTAYHQGEIVNDIMLNNTHNTRKRHYSKGNILANNGMMQDTVSIREEQVKSRVSTQKARENLSLDVLVIEEENKISIPELSRTTNGGSCAAPFGEKSRKYTKKALKQGLAKEGERLACADLLGCFGCTDQVIVQSVSDIWCLLSFKASIEESLFLHLDASHYRKNFEYIVKFIEQKILPSINKRILRKAEIKLNDEGNHPAWDDIESVWELIPKSTAEAR